MAFGSFWGWTPLGSKQGVKTACCCFRIGSEKICRRNLHSERESVRCSWQRILRRFWQMLWRTGGFPLQHGTSMSGTCYCQFGDCLLLNSFCKHQKHLLNPLTISVSLLVEVALFFLEFWDTSRFQTDNLTRRRLEVVIGFWWFYILPKVTEPWAFSCQEHSVSIRQDLTLYI